MGVMARVKVIKSCIKKFVYINLALSIPVYIYFMYEMKQMGLY